jgi:hypothetical protein
MVNDTRNMHEQVSENKTQAYMHVSTIPKNQEDAGEVII